MAVARTIVAVLAAAATLAAAAPARRVSPGVRAHKRVAPCDPIGPDEYCLFPYPNAFYLAEVALVAAVEALSLACASRGMLLRAHLAGCCRMRRPRRACA